jgi:pyridoxal phosphate enzyme (YggS family)
VNEPSIAQNLAAVRAEMQQAALAAGRDPASVLLLAVSKTQPAEAIVEAYEAGQRDFGENYVQELTRKAEALAHLPDIRWHHIGHVQTNKVRQLAPVVSLVHAVDRESLVGELDRRALGSGRCLDVLAEVNIAGELSKSGCEPVHLAELLAALGRAQHLRVRGLMTMPPLDEDPEASRLYLRGLRELRDRHGGSAALPELSMGMSHDFRVAIAEGATIVRIGTAIFGERPSA